ncbi:hypothetical protein ACOMHN_002937 [Nucella lapillus]
MRRANTAATAAPAPTDRGYRSKQQAAQRDEREKRKGLPFRILRLILTNSYGIGEGGESSIGRDGWLTDPLSAVVIRAAIAAAIGPSASSITDPCNQGLGQ